MILFILIFFSMIIVVGSASILGFAFYVKRRRKRLSSVEEYRQIEPPPFRPLFAPTDEEIQTFEKEEQDQHEKETKESRRKELLLRAETKDFNALQESKDDPKLYDEVLSALIGSNDSGGKILAIVEFILKNDLSSNAELTEKFGDIQKKNPTRKWAVDYLELAAHSGSAKVYLTSLEAILDEKKQGRLNFLNKEELILISEANFRILPTDEKASGAGFLIKQKLSEISELFDEK